MRRVLLLCIVAAFLVPSAGRGQTFFYTQYCTAQGLPASEVRAVTRDRIGFLGVATDNGLARYDG
jgi:ligand-binding sensor domain-containing protein